MKMISMKNSESKPEGMAYPSMPEYPYGLRLCLNEDSIKKLGLKELPDLDSTMLLNAKVQVCSISEDKQADGTVYRRLEVQITELGFGPEKAGGKETAEKLYS